MGNGEDGFGDVSNSKPSKTACSHGGGHRSPDPTDSGKGAEGTGQSATCPVLFKSMTPSDTVEQASLPRRFGSCREKLKPPRMRLRWRRRFARGWSGFHPEQRSVLGNLRGATNRLPLRLGSRSPSCTTERLSRARWIG